MTPAEAAALLGIAAGFDNRKVDETGETARLWAKALDNVSWADATDALADHFRETTEYLMPAHVIQRVKRARSKRLAEAPPLTPPDLPPLETIAWLREARRRVADGETVQDTRGQLRPRHLPDMRALMPKPAPVTTADPLPAHDPQRDRARAAIATMNHNKHTDAAWDHAIDNNTGDK